MEVLLIALWIMLLWRRHPSEGVSTHSEPCSRRDWVEMLTILGPETGILFHRNVFDGMRSSTIRILDPPSDKELSCVLILGKNDLLVAHGAELSDGAILLGPALEDTDYPIGVNGSQSWRASKEWPSFDSFSHCVQDVD